MTQDIDMGPREAEFRAAAAELKRRGWWNGGGFAEGIGDDTSNSDVANELRARPCAPCCAEGALIARGAVTYSSVRDDAFREANGLPDGTVIYEYNDEIAQSADEMIAALLKAADYCKERGL